MFKDLFYGIINGFALGTVDVPRLNYGVISLIPKVKGADTIKQYRPITLINVPFKICSKAYATRLAPVAQRDLNHSQSGFLKGRNILEGLVVLQEIVHELKRTRQPAVLLKLDFEKAYDRVNWEFIREVLTRKGFESGFVHRIMHLVSGGQTAVSINGEVGNFFRNKRGLRQGDPLSPYLFLFVAEALSLLLKDACEKDALKEFHVNRQAPGISHPLFADDSLLFFRGSIDQALIIKNILSTYEGGTGQLLSLISVRLNLAKSVVWKIRWPRWSFLILPHNVLRISTLAYRHLRVE